MRMILFILALLLALPCYAGQGMGPGPGCKGYSSGQTFLINEGFEGTGAPSGWQTGGTINYDYTTVILSGTQSCFIASSSYSNYIAAGFTAQDTVYIAFKIQAKGTTPSGTNDFFEIFTGGSTIIATGNILDSTKKIGVTISGGTSVAGSSTLALDIDATRFLKFKYVKGTGSNATMTAWISSDGTTWQQSATTTNGTSTAQSDAFDIYSNPSSDYVIDDVKISATDINW